MTVLYAADVFVLHDCGPRTANQIMGRLVNFLRDRGETDFDVGSADLAGTMARFDAEATGPERLQMRLALKHCGTG